MRPWQEGQGRVLPVASGVCARLGRQRLKCPASLGLGRLIPQETKSQRGWDRASSGDREGRMGCQGHWWFKTSHPMDLAREAPWEPPNPHLENER